MRVFSFSVGLLLAACSSNPISPTNPLPSTAGDLAILPVADLSVAPDDLTPPDYTGITCGTSSAPCTSGSQVCCLQQTGQSSVSAMCVAPTECPDGGASAACDGPEDCTNGSCCFSVKVGASSGSGTPNPQGAGSSCDTTCPAGLNGSLLSGGDVTTKLCHAGSDCANYQGNIPMVGMTSFNKCCATSQAPSVHFCAPSLGATAGYYTCL